MPISIDFNKKKEPEKTPETGNDAFTSYYETIAAGTKTVVDLLDALVKDAMKNKASDIHIEPEEKDLSIRYRVDGLLRDISKLNLFLANSLIFRIKVAAKLRTDEHFAPQDGKIRFKIDDSYVDTRISILPTTKGEKVVMRLLSKERSFELKDMGLEGEDLAKVVRSYTKPYGMILATGPTGSGKTTTLYAILSKLNSREKNITTLEDPVEYDLDGVNHIQINPKADLTFANGLRSILRQDPDIIMVGEIRDSETAKIAINAAMTGHLLLSTLHTNDSITTLPRLIDMGVEPYLVGSTVNVIIAQRLARKLCENCKKKTTLTEEALNNMTVERPDIKELMKSGETIYEPVGCTECNGIGYRGRIGLYEILEVTESLRMLIFDKTKTLDDIYKQARKNGLVLIVEDGVKKVKTGVTSLDELKRVTALKE